jgi:hypothetical protein
MINFLNKLDKKEKIYLSIIASIAFIGISLQVYNAWQFHQIKKKIINE